MGYPDLDSRPAPTVRDNLPHQIQNCPNCGYVAPEIAEEIENKGEIRDLISTNTYKGILENPNKPILANLFICASIINRKNNNLEELFWHLLKAAWVCDDAGDDVNAASLRKSAITITLEMNKAKINFNEPETEIAIITDLYRRTAEFEKAKQTIEENINSIQDERINQILNYQLKLIEKKDVACHSIEEAVIV